MRIWIDADACPRMAKEAVYKAAFRWKIPTVLVANQGMVVPRANLVSLVVVGKGIDEADHHIVDNSLAGDLVITADIPLADRLVEKCVVAIDPRGNVFTPANVKEALATRNLMQELRESGMTDTGGPAPITDKDRERFINALERELVRLQKKKKGGSA
jgi:hypothetical protein